MGGFQKVDETATYVFAVRIPAIDFFLVGQEFLYRLFQSSALREISAIKVECFLPSPNDR